MSRSRLVALHGGERRARPKTALAAFTAAVFGLDPLSKVSEALAADLDLGWAGRYRTRPGLESCSCAAAGVKVGRF